jgi:hypothetical protein
MAAHATSTGKVLLAMLDRDVLRHRLRDWQPVQLTPYTIMSERVLLTALARVAERGWAPKVEEGTLGTASVAASIVDATGETVAASVVAPVFRATGAATRGYRGAAVNAATAISRRLGRRGARPPTGIGRAGPRGFGCRRLRYPDTGQRASGQVRRPQIAADPTVPRRVPPPVVLEGHVGVDLDNQQRFGRRVVDQVSR